MLGVDIEQNGNGRLARVLGKRQQQVAMKGAAC